MRQSSLTGKEPPSIHAKLRLVLACALALNMVLLALWPREWEFYVVLSTLIGVELIAAWAAYDRKRGR